MSEQTPEEDPFRLDGYNPDAWCPGASDGHGHSMEIRFNTTRSLSPIIEQAVLYYPHARARNEVFRHWFHHCAFRDARRARALEHQELSAAEERIYSNLLLNGRREVFEAALVAADRMVKHLRDLPSQITSQNRQQTLDYVRGILKDTEDAAIRAACRDLLASYE